ncbi:MAG: hypothetical protein KC503_42415 [Myxococcales bacterium]|nr:hypothetical protein [Myxococcales bacterium]
MVSAALGVLLVLVSSGCDGGGGTQPPAPDGGGDGDGGGSTVTLHLGDVVDADGEGHADVVRTLTVAQPLTVIVELDGAPRVIEAALDAAQADVQLALDGGELGRGDVWMRPRPVTASSLRLTLEGSGDITLRVYARGAPPPPVREARGLVWTDAALLDAPKIVGLGRVLAAASSDGHGGRLLDAWLRRFSTTAHSERVGPALLADEIAATQGSDPSKWDLDALPFRVTAVHNRLDLGPRGGGCGELRVSMASTHPVHAPLHMIFLFRQPAGDDDTAPDGTVHCHGTARRWARLSALDGAAFASAATALLDATLVRERFLLAETVELTVSPWEWRQWKLEPNADPKLPERFENPPLFQTLDVDALNAAGARRDDFLTFVAKNAAGLDARTVELPERFRAASARVPPGVPRTDIDLGGLDAKITSAYPSLQRNLGIVGCPVCHTTDAEFVQTTPQRTFSTFYKRELLARAAYLDAMNQGQAPATPPFGPLQTLP